MPNMFDNQYYGRANRRIPSIPPQNAYWPYPGTVIPGKIIDSLEDITPQEIPMDGSAALFPMRDDSCIYAKAWGNTGLIETRKYILESPIEIDQNNKQPSEFEMVMQRLDKIEKMLSPVEKEVEING